MVSAITISKPAGGTITLQTESDVSASSKSLIVSNNASVEAVMISVPKYGSTSDQTDVLDYGGVIKMINYEGVFVGASAAIVAWIDSCEALINGEQSQTEGYPLTLTDPVRHGSSVIYVKVMRFTSNFDSGDATRITWSLKLIQASNNS